MFVSRNNVDVTIPVAKESPFLTSLISALGLLRVTGHLAKLKAKYSLDLKDHEECDPAVVGSTISSKLFVNLLLSLLQIQLGLQETFLPFAGLVLGLSLAVITSMTEKYILQRLRTRHQDKEKYARLQKKALQNVIERRLPSMSLEQLKNIIDNS